MIWSDEKVKAALLDAKHRTLIFISDQRERLELCPLFGTVPGQHLVYVLAKTFNALPSTVSQDFCLRVVAHLAGELGEILGLELAAVDPLQPAFAANLAQVGGHRVIVDLRPGDQEYLGLHAPHGSAHYRAPATFSRARHRSRTLPMIWCPARPDAVRIDSGWNCTAHRAAAGSSIAITTPSAPSGEQSAAVTSNPPRTSPAGAYRLWYRPAVNSAGSPASSAPPDTRTRPGLPCAGSGSRDRAPPACSTMACKPRQTPNTGRCRA